MKNIHEILGFDTMGTNTYMPFILFMLLFLIFSLSMTLGVKILIYKIFGK